MKVLNARYYIYRHIRPDTNAVFYIGLGCYQKKWKYQRAYTSKNRNIHWTRIVSQIKGAFIVDILMDNLTKDQAIECECGFIKLYGRSDLKQGPLCNLTNGGEGVVELSKESRKKISESRLGSKNPMYGKKQSIELIAKRTAHMKGESNPNYGKSIPEYHKEINRQTQLGRKHSKETIELRASQIRKKVVLAKDGIVHITFNSILNASKYFKVSSCTITRWCKSGKNNLRFD
jgi:group I intron endonuclease